MTSGEKAPSSTTAVSSTVVETPEERIDSQAAQVGADAPRPGVRKRFWVALALSTGLALLASWLLYGGGLALIASRLGSTSLPTDVGQRAPDLSLETLDGKMVRLADLRGQVVLLNFWATWCAPCRAEMPEIQSAYDANRARGFEVLAINLQERPEEIRPFLAELGLSFPVLLDRDGVVSRQYLARALPASYLIDREGIIRYGRIGTLSHDALAEQLRKLGL
jgi:peroxiredoxin